MLSGRYYTAKGKREKGKKPDGAWLRNKAGGGIAKVRGA